MPEQSRREFIKFIGASYLGSFALPSIASSNKPIPPRELPFLPPQDADDLVLAKGFSYKNLLSWGDEISSVDTFGFNCDYTAFIELSANSGIFWTNHEYCHPLFIHGNLSKTKKDVEKEMYNMGGSLVEIFRPNKNAPWQLQKNSPYNRRITSLTKIPFSNETKIHGKNYAIGMVSNCAGGTTPWGTILTCEENYDSYHGERKSNGKKKKGKHQWEKYYDLPPEHYGWVVEIEPKTGKAKKHISLGRFCHECATVTTNKQGQLVVYSGDDSENEFLYKFISESGNSLDKGILHVAKLETGEWLPLDLEKSPTLKQNFKSQLEVMINCRKAAKVLGATPLDRPEDIEVHPKTGEVFICLSNNKDKGNFHGSILKIKESSSSSTSFSHETFMSGGNHFSCPDNLTFDREGNIWLCCDISGKRIGKAPYTKFKNNGLFYIPTSGPHQGEVVQIASAPNDAELTGVTLSPDEKTLFLSVQHPGEMTRSLDNLTSNWPDNKKGAIPRPTVVQIKGPLLS